MKQQKLTKRTYFDIIIVLFVVLLVVSNIAATKLIQIGPLIFDGGALLFPLTYVLGDVLTEVYGFKKARRAIFLGFGAAILAALTFLAVQYLPGAPQYVNQASFEAVLGFVPTIVIASVSGFIAGQLINAFVLTKIKAKMHGKRLWVRLVISTLAGETVDTVLFCTIAFYGVLNGGPLLNYILAGITFKIVIEILVMPITYRVVQFLRQRDVDALAL